MNSPQYVWQLDNVSLHKRLSAVSLNIAHGLVALVGPSGIGKTSLLNLLAGYELPSSGKIDFSPHHANTTIHAHDHSENNPNPPHNISLGPAIYWQPPDFGLWAHMNVREHLLQVLPPLATPKMDLIIERLKMNSFIDQLPATLSQGQQSRTAFARAILSDAAALVLDEPTTYLDQSLQHEVWQIMREYVDQGRTIILATHDIHTAGRHADHIISMQSTDDSNSQHFETKSIGNKLEQNQNHNSPNMRTQPTQSNHKNCAHFFTKPNLKPLLLLLLIYFTTQLTACTETDSDGIPVLQFKKVNSWSIPNDGPRIPAPRSIGVAKDGRVIVLDNAGRVLIYNKSGKVVQQWFMPEYDVGRPEGIVVLNDSRIAVADTHYSRIVIFNPDGSVSKMFGKEGRGPGEFIYPVAITQDIKGNLYVGEYGTNDRVQKFTPDGQFLLAMGSFGTAAGQFQRASGVVWRDGVVYVADAVNNRVQAFSDDGKFLRIVTENAKVGLNLPYDIGIDGKGDLYLVEYSGNCVTKVSVTGELLGRYGRSGSKLGQFRTPWGIAVDTDGRVIVADTTNRRVMELIP